jgi:glycine cleavage system H protein
VETNQALKDSPQFVNEDPYGKGWIIKMEIKDKAELKKLLSFNAYRDFVSKEEE